MQRHSSSSLHPVTTSYLQIYAIYFLSIHQITWTRPQRHPTESEFNCEEMWPCEAIAPECCFRGGPLARWPRWVESWYSRAPYEKIRRDIPNTQREDLLQMAVKPIKDTIGLSGVSTTHQWSVQLKARHKAYHLVEKHKAKTSAHAPMTAKPPVRSECDIKVLPTS